MPEQNLNSELYCSVDDLVDVEDIGHSSVHGHVG